QASPAPCTPAAPRPTAAKKALFSGGRGKAKPKDEAALEEPQEKPSKSDLKAFQKAVEALLKELSEARARLQAGMRPPAEAIEKARKALQKELSGSALGTKLPELQRLLRQGLLELVALLESGGTSTAQMLLVLERCSKDLEEALRAGSPEGERFWEATI
ncbi:MAG TPA: hypothetical protein VEN81_00565, partial [Planctomycetota bacterium]|nr:hypothetical protein [Planctomycetota bacterium]